MANLIEGAKHYTRLEGKRRCFDVLYLSHDVPKLMHYGLMGICNDLKVVEDGLFFASTDKGFSPDLSRCPARPEAFYLSVSEESIALVAKDYQGFLHGLVALSYSQNCLGDCCFEISDYPSVLKRGLMLDVSRGKVYTIDAIKRIIKILCLARYNTLQLYIEHVFMFKGHPEIGELSGGYTAEDILEIRSYAAEHGIELQANLQLFGHCRRLLTRPAHMSLRESDFFWTLSPSDEGTYDLIDDLLSEFLPLFDSEYVNICSDETYDLCGPRSRNLGKDKGRTYMAHLLRVRDIAAKYGKKIQVFGDIVLKHPDLVSELPSDIVFLDWIYDPKAHYGTPEVFREKNRRFWVCPGTGAWNSLFPRLDGSLTNISNLLREGLESGAEGILLTDWNDHGGYPNNSFSHFSYVFAGLASWLGKPDFDCDDYVAWCTGEPEYPAIERLFASIYTLPPMWSRNRSQCVIALFEEPVRGKCFSGILPPPDFESYNLEIPKGLDPVYVKRKTNPLRPVMVIVPETRAKIRKIVSEIRSLNNNIYGNVYSDSIRYTCNAFELMCDKLDASNELVDLFSSGNVRVEDIVSQEDKVRLLIRRFIDLQSEFQKCWSNEARRSEIDEALMNFSNIISRYGYLAKWLASQRERIEDGLEVDCKFETYNDGGYTSLDTV